MLLRGISQFSVLVAMIKRTKNEISNGREDQKSCCIWISRLNGQKLCSKSQRTFKQHIGRWINCVWMLPYDRKDAKRGKMGTKYDISNHFHIVVSLQRKQNVFSVITLIDYCWWCNWFVEFRSFKPPFLNFPK